MNTRTFALSALGFLLAAGCASSPGAAQQSRDTTTRAERRERRPRGEMLFRGITLSAAQKQQVDSIRARHREEMRALRDSSGGDRQAMRGKMRDIMERHVAEVRAILTPDQQRVFDQNVAQMRQHMREHMRDSGGRGGHGADSTSHDNR